MLEEVASSVEEKPVIWSKLMWTRRVVFGTSLYSPDISRSRTICLQLQLQWHPPYHNLKTAGTYRFVCVYACLDSEKHSGLPPSLNGSKPEHGRSSWPPTAPTMSAASSSQNGSIYSAVSSTNVPVTSGTWCPMHTPFNLLLSLVCFHTFAAFVYYAYVKIILSFHISHEIFVLMVWGGDKTTAVRITDTWYMHKDKENPVLPRKIGIIMTFPHLYPTAFPCFCW